MDALELLISDHDKIRSLFGQIQNTSDPGRQKQLVEQACRELDTHTRIEESTFYPVFKRYEETSSFIDRAIGDHSTVKDLIQQIRSGGGDVRNLVSQLIEGVSRHAEEEEKELFPQIRKLMKRPEREQLGRHLQAAREEPVRTAA